MEKILLKHDNNNQQPNQQGDTLPFFKPVIQTKLSINAPGDHFEREADAMADRMMRMTDPSPKQNAFFKPAGNDVQRKCRACEEEDKFVHRKESNGNETDGTHSLDSYVGSLSSSGQAIPGGSRDFFEQRLGHDFSNVKVHTDSAAAESAQSINALAYTSGNNIVFNSGQYSPESDSGKRLMAHELTHVIQQQGSAPGNGKINRQPSNTPYNKALVEQSKRRLKLLYPRLNALKAWETQIDVDKTHAFSDRRDLDQHSSQLGWQNSEAQEESNFTKLNTGAVNITVAANEVIFKVNFQAFFLDPANKKFAELTKSLTDGIALVWNQTLSGGALGGRKFSIVPTITLIDNLTDRKADAWLIEVRKADNDPVVHPGCKLPQPDPKIPTSVTDSNCDNGVMNLPPSHVTKPGILGHEMLHLFGLLDRYMMLIHQPAQKGGKPTFETSPTREAGGRKDPLGGEDGTILSEDLNYLFLKLGVYDTEKSRSLGDLPGIQKEIWRLEKIVKLGYDPDSLIPVRKDFNDKMLRDAENL